MQKIENIGNLPAHLQAFIGKIGGLFSRVPLTEFYKMDSVQELETNATEIGYEITPTIDTSTSRGFLVGFDVTEPKKIVTLVSYATLRIYFVETDDSTIRDWTQKIRSHHDMQQNEMYIKRETIKLNRATRRALKLRGGRK